MALKTIELTDLVDALDEIQSDYADFFRPMLGYEAILKLYDGIQDDVEPLLTEVEDETGFEFPPDLISLYICTNGGTFGDLELFPITKDKSVPNNINNLNVIDKSMKEAVGLNNKSLLIGKYADNLSYIICYLKDDGVYSYALYDVATKKIKMEFEYIIQLIALEISYETDYENLMDYANSDN